MDSPSTGAARLPTLLTDDSRLALKGCRSRALCPDVLFDLEHHLPQTTEGRRSRASCPDLLCVPDEHFNCRSRASCPDVLFDLEHHLRQTTEEDGDGGSKASAERAGRPRRARESLSFPRVGSSSGQTASGSCSSSSCTPKGADGAGSDAGSPQEATRPMRSALRLSGAGAMSLAGLAIAQGAASPCDSSRSSTSRPSSRPASPAAPTRERRSVIWRRRTSEYDVPAYSTVYERHPRLFNFNKKGEMIESDEAIAEEAEAALHRELLESRPSTSSSKPS